MAFTLESAAAFTKAIQEHYYFEFLFGTYLSQLQFKKDINTNFAKDDLPIFGFVGASDSSKYYLFTHWSFTILYNKDQVNSIFLFPSSLLSSFLHLSLLIKL